MSQSDETVKLFKAIKVAERLAERLNNAADRHLQGAYFSVNLALADEECAELAPSELEQASRFAVPERLSSWKRGRNALKTLLKRAGLTNLDTSQLALPDPNFSLTHSANLALAAYVNAHGAIVNQTGTGVDFESTRRVNPRAARFFLQPSELQWLSRTSKAHRNFHLLRLWTIKEALFKADPTNRVDGRFPGQYVVSNPSEVAGIATHPLMPNLRFLYATTDLDDGLVSIAVAVRGAES